MTDKRVTIETTMGSITIELDEGKAPNTAANFLQYVEDGFYVGTIFHRVIDGFMVQGGGLDAKMNNIPTREPIENEANNGLSNSLGTVAMARTNDPHSATAQFFINVKDNDFLDHKNPSPEGWGYCVFGRVVEGSETVSAMKSVETGTGGGMRDVPTQPIEILSAIIEPGQ
jgi:peptidyl-prolyl cis-trans isomerase B (cyclophilin B)